MKFYTGDRVILKNLRNGRDSKYPVGKANTIGNVGMITSLSPSGRFDIVVKWDNGSVAFYFNHNLELEELELEIEVEEELTYELYEKIL